ncbi:MAG: hypothetical protein U0736_17410 [Gemmataceae bacterium]
MARTSVHARRGAHVHENAIILTLIVVVCLTAIRLMAGSQPADTRPMWDRVVASLLGVLQCFGMVLGVSIVLASVEVIKQTAARYQAWRVGTKLAHLEALTTRAQARATAGELSAVLRCLLDTNDGIRHRALSTSFILLRASPALATGSTRVLLERALLQTPGFAWTLAETPLDADLRERVTLGAKLGAGTTEKRLMPVTSNPEELARWVEACPRHGPNPEIQVSVGYDTGPLPSLLDRARFLALYLFISTTDLSRFQGLLRRPPRDPNAAYGLLIRGDVVEVRYPGQCRGHRLDYVFPLPTRLSTANLAGLFREIQLLNLGLLVASATDAGRVLLGGDLPSWVDSRRAAIGRMWRGFERKLVALLRRYDRYREPRHLHRLIATDDLERVQAFEQYRLEECLYPQYSWVVPLYDPDTRWDRLLAPLRGVEGMLLHQGEVDGFDVTRGTDFIHQMRRLGYRTASAIEAALAGDPVPRSDAMLPPDPFIDPAEEEATQHYLRRVSMAIARGETTAEELPDPTTFRQALAYYDIGEQLAPTENLFPEVDR